MKDTVGTQVCHGTVVTSLPCKGKQNRKALLHKKQKREVPAQAKAAGATILAELAHEFLAL